MRSDKVDAAAEAYTRLNMPDGALGLGSYAATMGLAGMGMASRTATTPRLPLLLSTKVGLDTAFAAKLTMDQWTRHRAFCIYCLLASAVTVTTVPLVVPETRAALRHLMGD